MAVRLSEGVFGASAASWLNAAGARTILTMFAFILASKTNGAGKFT